MNRRNKYLTILVLVFVLAVAGGCSAGDDKPQEKKTTQDKSVQKTTGAAADVSVITADAVSTEAVVTEEAARVASDGLRDLPSSVMYTTAKVRVRALPSQTAEVIKTLPSHTQVEVKTTENGWSSVLLDDQIYYISSDYLTQQEQPDENTVETTNENTADSTNEIQRSANSRLVVIDAGHQRRGNSEKEPVGPGASEMKAKVASGTSGCVSGLNEYELNLMVALKLQQVLEQRGYTVIMVRTTNDVNISNAQRAEVANSANADAFVRIHANGSENSSTHGAMTICQTSGNRYNADKYEQSKRLSTNVLDGLVAATGCSKQYVWETDTMSGINWAQVPVTIVEMGYMTNPEEDRNMASDDYQNKIAQGIANGLDTYFGIN